MGNNRCTRTICFSEVSNREKNIFTRVLKGHIAVALSNIKTEMDIILIKLRKS